MTFAGPAAGAALVLAGLGMPFVATAAAAQAVLRGLVLDDETAQPIGQVRIEFLDRLQRRWAVALSDDSGQFVFRNAPLGAFRLRAMRIGYQAVTTPRWWLEQGDSVSTEIRLHPTVMLLAPLEITARVRTSPILEEFYHRKAGGFGTYITQDEIARRGAYNVTELLAGVPGVHIVQGSRGRGGVGGRNVAIGRALPGCVAQIYVDGLLMNVAADPDFVLDDVVRPDEIEGIEIYHGMSTTPGAFATREARCGVVAIWTRRGPRRR